MKEPVIDILDPCSDGVIRATEQQLNRLGITEEDIKAGFKRGILEEFGPWSFPLSFRAIIEHKEYSESSRVTRARFWPPQTLSKPKQDGHCLEGVVSWKGKKLRGFTAFQLFELPDGTLINVETIFVCPPRDYRL